MIAMALHDDDDARAGTACPAVMRLFAGLPWARRHMAMSRRAEAQLRASEAERAEQACRLNALRLSITRRELTADA